MDKNYVYYVAAPGQKTVQVRATHPHLAIEQAAIIWRVTFSRIAAYCDVTRAGLAESR